MQRNLAAQYILNRLKDELSPDLTYHNVTHTEDVYSAAQLIAREEGITGRDLELTLTAALFHDTGFLINGMGHGHEVLSCSIARETLPAFEYSATDISLITELILATEIPQRPDRLLEQVLCDADLDYLGRDDFFQRSELLYNEMRKLGAVASRTDYDRLQLAFLRGHTYFTETSKRMRNQKKLDNLQKLIALS
jgi:Predicted HD superfamily hydrolase